jgi:hypothetical protein
MEKLKKYEKILESKGDKLVPMNPHTDSIYPINLKSFNINYNPSLHRDKKFREVHESIVKEGYNPLKYDYIVVLNEDRRILDGKKRIKALRLAGATSTTPIPVKLMKVINQKKSKKKLTTTHKGILIMFFILTLFGILLSQVISLFL